MDKRIKKLKFHFITFLSILIGYTVVSTAFMVWFAYRESFRIVRTDWLTYVFTNIASCATVFLGYVSYWQNERFKIESDISSEKSEEKNAEYQKQLLQINNRIMRLEENKEYAFITFIQGPVLVCNQSTPFQIEGKKYTALISNSGHEIQDCIFFVFQITNQTDIPIRYFQIKEMRISYMNYETGEENRVTNYKEGGFVPAPIIDKGEAISYVLGVNNQKDFIEGIPYEGEINLILLVEVESIYNRKVNQKFLLRLQRKNAFFDAGKDENIFWNYCFEASANRIDESDN